MALPTKLSEAVLFGAAAALGSTVVALLFRMIDRRFDSHHLFLPQGDYMSLPEVIQTTCIYPSSCSVTVAK